MKRIVSLFLVIQLAGILLFIATMPAHADSFGFYNITNTADVNVEGQFIVDVTSYDTDQVLFTFYNNGPYASFIGAVYFDDGNLLNLSDIIDNSPSVSFTQDSVDEVKPKNLPGGTRSTRPHTD